MEDGKFKNKCLPELVKSALILLHLNADVERSLSGNTSVVTKDRPHIGEATVCAMKAVEFFYTVSNQTQKVPLTRELLRSAKMAYVSYKD